MTAPAADSRTPVVALVGNPNTGKTTLFNALSGLRQRVGNYPGVTVEMKKGRLTHGGQSFDLVDLPGTYSLAPRSPDEMVAVDLLLGRQEGEPRPDAVVSIVDAANLERNLYLTTQVLELGEPVVVALNMVDVAEAHGITVDAARLAQQLGVPVVPIQANKGKGLDDLKEAVAAAAAAGKPPAKRPAFPPAFETEVTALSSALGGSLPDFLVRRLLLDVGGHTEKVVESAKFKPLESRLQAASGPAEAGTPTTRPELSVILKDARARLAAAGAGVPAVEAKVRYGWIREVVAGCVQRPAVRPVTWTDKLDRVLTHRVWGTLIFLALMFLVFQSIFTWAKPLMDLVKSGQDALADKVGDAMPPGALNSLVTKGIIGGVGSVLVFLPQILILFAFVAVLEDCGYMARAAFLMDRLMSRCGLSGKSFIPLLSSVACAVPGIMATRVIENSRDRLATILVAPLMSCSARLPVYILIIGAFLTHGYPWWVPGLTLFAMYMIGFVVAPIVALILKSTLLRGDPPVFVMEMPVYKRPSSLAVLRRMGEAGWAFTKRAGTFIFATMILIWALIYFPRGNVDGKTYEELFEAKRELRDEEHDKIEEFKKTLSAEARAEIEEPGDDWKPPADLVPVKERMDALDEEMNKIRAEWTAQSWLGRAGKFIEPVVRPLGWDWKIGMAAIASFPAREVVVGTLGIIYGVGEVDSGELSKKDVAETPLAKEMSQAEFDDHTPVFTIPTALSLMVFFALCMQCASTLAVIRRETRSWYWPVFTFVYMTALAYLGALAVYQIGSRM